jgi:hypothetical protein
VVMIANTRVDLFLMLNSPQNGAARICAPISAAEGLFDLLFHVTPVI